MTDTTKVLILLCGVIMFGLLTYAALSLSPDNSTTDEELLNLPNDIVPQFRDDAALLEQSDRFEAQRQVNATISADLPALVDQAQFFSVFVEDTQMIFAEELAGGRVEAEAQCDAVAYDVVFATKLVTCVYDGEVMYSDAFVPG